MSVKIIGTVYDDGGDEVASIETWSVEEFLATRAAIIGAPAPAQADEAPAVPCGDVLAVGEGAFPGDSVAIVFHDDAVVQLPDGSWSVLLYPHEVEALKAALS